MDNCIFCKIVKGEIPSYKIYEDQNVYAFLDISKDFYGHTLVVTKNHYKNILDVPENELTLVMNAVKKISNHYVNDLGFDGINTFNNNEESAGQSVMHLHFHIIPRKNNDNIKIFTEGNKQEIDIEEVYNHLKIN